jgi:hypothetical protein
MLYKRSARDKVPILSRKKKILRISKSDIKYNYSERAMLTSEETVNRSIHVVEDIKTKKLRILTPVETERLNRLPDNWTRHKIKDMLFYDEELN